MFDLKDRTALVTGASRGIGEATARLLGARGARVVLAARSRERLEELADELTAEGVEAAALELDLSRPEGIKEALGQLESPFDQIDVLVSNAGVTDDNLLVRMSLEQWQRVIDTNLTAAYALCRELARGMMKRRYGRIVLVSSVVGLMGNAGQTNYAASKAGLVGFAKSLARELGSRGITVNVVAPGYVETDMTRDLPENVTDRLTQEIVLGRLGSVDDIAAAILYLASLEAGYVTGEVLNVSGGLYL
jgi:3-oxoacyl-[acyl-carrier protein] reductase